MIKVLIVDDHELVRTGIKRLLSDVPGLEVIGEADTGEKAIKIAREKIPNVVLMDVKMPGMGGLEATKRLLRVDDNIKVLVVTSCDDEPFPSRMLQAGAVGYLTKGCPVEEMEKAIRTVFAGNRYISPEIAQRLAFKHINVDEKSPFDGLSERELQVMMMITVGVSVQEISEKLNLSPKTVNSYRYRLFEKLKVNNDVELTHLAIRHGMIDSIAVKLADDNDEL